jgi:hypothetical protein
MNGAGSITVAPGASANLLTVGTFNVAGAADDRSFSLLVAC